MREILRAGVILALAAGCASAPPPRVPPKTVAVLPFDNKTNDVGAPEYVRSVLSERLPARRFTVLPQAGVDDALRNLGVSQGGQLRTLEPAKIAAATGAEFLFYGTVEAFTHITAGVAEKREVTVSTRVVDASGRQRWAASRSASNGDVNLGAVSSFTAFGKALGGQLRDKLVEGALSHKLSSETRSCVDALVGALPRGGF